MAGILNNTAYNLTSPILTGEVDCENRLKISALMKRHQEIGELHLNVFGASSAKMRLEQNLAFIFTKVNIKITRLPSLDETVTLTTWCSSLKGVRFARNYVLSDEKGRILTETKAEVTTIDLESRKIVRPNEINGFGQFLYNEELGNAADYPTKISVAQSVGQSFFRKITEADIDFNGHVNNTVYADMVVECLDNEFCRKTPTGFMINYQNEALLKETVEISKSVSGHEILFLGKIGDKNCFVAQLFY